MTELLTREFEFRAEDINAESREIVGQAVPYGRDADIGGNYFERFGADAVQDSDDALLFWRHGEPVGRITSAKNTPDGWQIRARISETSLGNDALTLARDGVVKQLSVGFESIDDTTETRASDGATVITRNAVRVREVSLVPFGAYADDATITEVRERTPNTERTAMTEITADAPDLTEVRERIDELERRSAQYVTRDSEPVADTRSAAEVLKAVAKGDDNTIRAVNEVHERAYTGGTTADASLQNAWVGDLTKIMDTSSGVLSQVFSTGSLPAQGLTLEYGKLGSNTVALAQQAAEGDTINAGKVTLTTATADVHTYAGSVTLSRQAIERSTMPLLQRNLEAMAVAAGVNKKAVLRADYDALVAARRAISSNGGIVLGGAALGSMTPALWIAAVVAAAKRFDLLGYSPEAIIVTDDVFTALANTSTTGERFLRIADGNSVGTLNLPGLSGDLNGLPVLVDVSASSGVATAQAVFVNGAAIRQYDSGTVQLQADNVLNLSRDFAVYRYGAVADETPDLVVPVKFAAS